MAEQRRRLPVGLQSFKEIRRGGYVYVDKTDVVWNMVNNGVKYNYLNRPRRFGKSLLVDTLECYLTGQKELFEGLKIMDLETEWNNHPVIRLDMSFGGATAEALRSYLHNSFSQYEKTYGITPLPNDSLGARFDRIIRTAYNKTNLQVAILIDEYDAPLQHSWRTPEHEDCTAIYREVFAILKGNDEFEKLVFITGITKFTQISLFSVLNNLSNISFDSSCATVCGITEEEMLRDFQPEMQNMAEHYKWTLDETRQRLKDYYDGYHFSPDNMVDIYNPFSLVNALHNGEIRNYWAASGATSLLPKFVDDMEIHIEDFDQCYLDADTIKTSDVSCGGAELFLYQSGYLTIKSTQDDIYTLGFPNTEVRQALSKFVIPALTMRSINDVLSTQSRLKVHLYNCNLPEAMKCLKALIADVPYSNKKLQSMDMEERYRLIISTILNAIGLQVRVEHMLSTGRIDIVAKAPRYVYIMELKLSNNGGILAAGKQIEEKGYAQPFTANDHRQPVCLAIELDHEGKGLTCWKEVKQ